MPRENYMTCILAHSHIHLPTYRPWLLLPHTPAKLCGCSRDHLSCKSENIDGWTLDRKSWPIPVCHFSQSSVHLYNCRLLLLFSNYRAGNRCQGWGGHLAQVHPAEGQVRCTRTEPGCAEQGDPVYPGDAPAGGGS